MTGNRQRQSQLRISCERSAPINRENALGPVSLGVATLGHRTK
jgi:hypothetical protein